MKQSEKKRIIKEDIETLEFLILKFTREGKMDKVAECQKEIERLRGKMNEAMAL